MHQVRSCLAVLALAAFGLTASGCATPGAASPPAVPRRSAPGEASTTVPDVNGLRLAAAAKLLGEANLAHIVRYAPEILTGPGSVVLSVPKAGTSASTGDVIVLVVAGAAQTQEEGTPGVRALAALADARQDVFVGVGRDGRGGAVVAVNPGVDLTAWQDRLDAAARGERFTVRQCEHGRDELSSLQAGLLPADLLPRAGQIHYSAALQPATCSVWVAGTFRPDEVKLLRQRYGAMLTIEVAGA
jgi:hypothetical protein